MFGTEEDSKIHEMRNCSFFLLLIAAAVFFADCQAAHAQYGGAQTGGGIAGLGMNTFTQGLGQTTAANGAFGSRTMGGSNYSNPSRTAMGGGGMFGAAQGNGMGQGFGIGNQGNSASITGNEWFVPGNRRTGQFVGSDSADASNFIGAFSQLTGTGQNGNQFGQFGQRNNLGNRQNQNQQGRIGRNGRQERTPVLKTYVASFNYGTSSTSSLGNRLAKQLSTSRSVKAIGPLAVQMEGRTAVLRGTVASEQGRDLAARLAMLEPGVSQVRNELQTESELPVPVPASDSANSVEPQVSPSLGQ